MDWMKIVQNGLLYKFGFLRHHLKPYFSYVDIFYLNVRVVYIPGEFSHNK